MRTGYKQTDVGVIPEEWEVEHLGDICGRITTGKLDANKMVADGDYPFFTCARESYRIDKFAFDYEALLVSGNGANVGYVHHYNGKFNAYQRTYIISDFSADVQFLKLFLERNLHERIRVEVNAGNTPYITMGTLTEMVVGLPTSREEQRAIASALGDMDALLASLDRLIAKKRDLKQAAMQQLLTGQTRLPGFHEKWEVKRVLELGEVVTGGTPRTDVAIFWGDGYPWITPTDISANRDMSTSDRTLTWKGLDSIRALQPNTVLVTCIASIGKNAILRTAGACNQQINAVTPNKNNSAEFLYYVFEASKQYLQANAGTTATSIISKAVFAQMTFTVPPLPEQTAIAKVLGEMDAELVALEQRRDKTRALKQAMMQELLTGRTRLL